MCTCVRKIFYFGLSLKINFNAGLCTIMPPVKKVKSRKASEAQSNDEGATAVISGQLDKKIKKQKQNLNNQRGIVFIKHLPHGFFEEQLKKYFEQFGNVTRLRLVRSKRTGGSKGFAFVEFEYPEVAQVAAETMDSYLMFKKMIKASYIPPHQQRFNYFKTSIRKVKNKSGKDIYVSAKSAAIQRKVKQQNNWTDDTYQKRTEMKLKKLEGLKKKYANLGIDFSNIVIMPKKKNPEDKTEKMQPNSAKSNDISQLKTKKKQKDVEAKPSQTPLKLKKDVELEDLLGNTLQEDSEDEDWIADRDDELTSDEETYGFQKNTDDETEDNIEDISESDEDDDKISSVIAKKSSKKNKKVTQSSKVDSFDKLTKRKPHLGGIQKKKPAKATATSKSKKALQITAFKELQPKKIKKKQK